MCSEQASHTGYRIMVAKMDGNEAISYEPFIQGWLEPGTPAQTAAGRAWGRPVDVVMASDGAPLISDERANAIYRVTRKR